MNRPSDEGRSSTKTASASEMPSARKFAAAEAGVQWETMSNRTATAHRNAKTEKARSSGGRWCESMQPRLYRRPFIDTTRFAISLQDPGFARRHGLTVAPKKKGGAEAPPFRSI